MDKTTLAHLYRAQVQRADMWRARLDSTTNWAVVSTAAALTVAFSNPLSGPMIIILATVIITLFLWIESRRYRYFELWSLRVRLLERNYLAPLLGSSEPVDEGWEATLAETLATQTFPIRRSEAFGRRYRSVYIWLQAFLALAFLIHVWLYPEPAGHFAEVWSRSLAGQFTVGMALLLGVWFQASLFGFGMLTRRFREAEGEVF